jgi:hypothetical protein
MKASSDRLDHVVRPACCALLFPFSVTAACPHAKPIWHARAPSDRSDHAVHPSVLCCSLALLSRAGWITWLRGWGLPLSFLVGWFAFTFSFYFSFFYSFVFVLAELKIFYIHFTYITFHILPTFLRTQLGNLL